MRTRPGRRWLRGSAAGLCKGPGTAPARRRLHPRSPREAPTPPALGLPWPRQVKEGPSSNGATLCARCRRPTVPRQGLLRAPRARCPRPTGPKIRRRRRCTGRVPRASARRFRRPPSFPRRRRPPRRCALRRSLRRHRPRRRIDASWCCRPGGQRGPPRGLRHRLGPWPRRPRQAWICCPPPCRLRPEACGPRWRCARRCSRFARPGRRRRRSSRWSRSARLSRRRRLLCVLFLLHHRRRRYSRWRHRASLHPGWFTRCGASAPARRGGRSRRRSRACIVRLRQRGLRHPSRRESCSRGSRRTLL